MLNKYHRRIEDILTAYRSEPLLQFRGPKGATADFDDLVWYHIDPNSGRKTRYLCIKHGKQSRVDVFADSAVGFRYPYNQLVKVWIIEVSNTALSAAEKTARVGMTRKLITLMDCELHELTAPYIESLNLGLRYPDRLRSFLKFCSDRGLMPRFDLASKDLRDRTGVNSLDQKLDKLPPLQTIVALGEIFASIFKNVSDEGFPLSGRSVEMHDALVVTSCLLSLASPNRLAAEVPLIPKQRLNSHSEADMAPVYFLDWIGSKGYKSNKNHILSALVTPIRKAINLFYEECEPARILCRFYENPNQPLALLLGERKVAFGLDEKIDLSQCTNMFSLGSALGFYSPDECVPVFKPEADMRSVHVTRRSTLFELKPIWDLKLEDKLAASRYSRSEYSALPKLFGYETMPKIFDNCEVVTVKQIQDWWVSYVKETLNPEFPFSYSTGDSKIRLRDALFCFRGDWLYGRTVSQGSGGKNFQQSKYAIVPLGALGSSISRRTVARTGTSIFESYNFSPELSLKLHSLRHFSNTLADVSGIPVEIITAWSGRASVEQTHTYIHTSHSEKAARVKAVMNPPVLNSNAIRVISRDELTMLAKVPATITSTGICTQNLNVSPCGYLNDFVSQCFLCPEACHVAGDLPAIELLEKDYLYQRSRLDSIVSDPRCKNSAAMKQWYILHSKNTLILTLLINMMKTQSIGSIIRYSKSSSEFHLTDVNTLSVAKVAFTVPDFEAELSIALDSLDSAEVVQSNPKLVSLLSSFGLS